MRETKEPSKKIEEARRRGLNKARRCCDSGPMDNHDNCSKASDASLKFRKKQMQERARAERTAARRAHAAALALEAHCKAEISEDTKCVNAETYENHSEDFNAIETSSDLQEGGDPAHAVNGNVLYAVLGVDQTATPAQDIDAVVSAEFSDVVGVLDDVDV